MLLLSSLLLLLLLGAPLGCAEDAAAALTLERILEWQGECPRGRRDQLSTSGTGVAKGEEKGRSWGRARAARAIGFRRWPRLCSPEKALWRGQSYTRTGLAPLSPSPAPPRSRRHPPVFSCGHERRGLGLQATGLNSGRAQAWRSRLGNVSKCKPPIVVYLGGPSLGYMMAKSCSILSPRKARALGLGHHLWSGPKRASPLRLFPERTLNLLY